MTKITGGQKMRTRADILADLELVENYKPVNYSSSMIKTADRNRLERELEEVEKSERKMDFYRLNQVEREPRQKAGEAIAAQHISNDKELKLELDGYTIAIKISKTNSTAE